MSDPRLNVPPPEVPPEEREQRDERQSKLLDEDADKADQRGSGPRDYDA